MTKKQGPVLPKTVFAGPFVFNIRSEAGPFMAAEESEKTRLYGRTDYISGTIDIRPAVALSFTQETLMHEALHAAFFAARLNPQNEEEVVNSLSPVLLDLLRRNPDLLNYLLA